MRLPSLYRLLWSSDTHLRQSRPVCKAAHRAATVRSWRAIRDDEATGEYRLRRRRRTSFREMGKDSLNRSAENSSGFRRWRYRICSFALHVRRHGSLPRSASMIFRRARKSLSRCAFLEKFNIEFWASGNSSDGFLNNAKGYFKSDNWWISSRIHSKFYCGSHLLHIMICLVRKRQNWKEEILQILSVVPHISHTSPMV